MHSQKKFIILLMLVAFAYPIYAQETEGETETSTKWPSPDGKFSFRIENQFTLDLIDTKSDQVVFHVADAEEENRLDCHVLWAPDSKRFALMTTVGRRMQKVSVYAKRVDTFHEVKLPDLPQAKIPTRLKRGKKISQVGNWNWEEAKEWKDDGSLVVTIETMVYVEDNGSLDARRTVVLEFDKSGKARIVKSTIKFETEHD